MKGALAFYDAMKKDRLDVKVPTIEKIAEANADGKLEGFIASAMEKCN